MHYRRVGVYIDDQTHAIMNISGYFEGYSWNVNPQFTIGRQEIVAITDSLPYAEHQVRFVIQPEFANKFKPKNKKKKKGNTAATVNAAEDVFGHNCQIIALLYQ